NQRTEFIDKQVLELLPHGIFSRKIQGYELFSSEKLFSSLLEIAIPIPIAFELIELIVPEIRKIFNIDKSTIISTTDIRKIIYQGIISMDYVKYGSQIG